MLRIGRFADTPGSPMRTGHRWSRSSPIREDLVPTWKAICRKGRVLSTTTPRSIVVPSSKQEFITLCVDIAGVAADRRAVDQKILALWQLEGLAFAFFENQDEWRVQIEDLELPPEAGPPVHCGIAMAAVLKYGFDADCLLDRIEGLADPTFAMFAIETIGLMLAVYERDFFGAATSFLGRIGVVRHTRLKRPPTRSFIESMPQRCRSLIAHGYGRALYFKRFSLLGAVKSAQRQKSLPVAATARGVAAAFTLINNRDLGLVLQLQGDASNVELAEGIEGGLMNTLALLEWSFPGCLASVGGITDRGSRLIGEATDRADDARRRGLGPPLVA